MAVIEDRGWDVSTRARDTGYLFDLTTYKTMGDFLKNFLKELNGNTVAAFDSGAGFAVERLDSCARDDVFDLVLEALHQAANDGLTSAPRPVAEFLRQLWKHNGIPGTG